MIEDVAFILQYDIPEEYLTVLFKNKGIYIDHQFYEQYTLLRKLYLQIAELYDLVTFQQFILATKQAVHLNKEETFSHFPDAHIFISFYSLFREMCLTRAQKIKHLLQELTFMVIEYDYYFTGRISTTLQSTHSIDFFYLLPSKDQIYAGNTRGQATVFNINTLLPVFHINFKNGDKYEDFLTTDNKNRIIIASRSIQIWEEGKIIVEIPISAERGAVTFIGTASVPIIIFGYTNGDVILWNSETQNINHVIKSDINSPVSCALVFQDICIIGWHNGLIRIHNVNTQKIIFTAYNENRINAIYGLYDSCLFLINSKIYKWDMKSGHFTQPFRNIKNIFILPNKDFLIHYLNTINVYCSDCTHKLTFNIDTHSLKISCISLLPDNTLLLSGENIIVMNIHTGEIIKMLGISGTIDTTYTLGNKIPILSNGKILILE